MKTHLPFLFFFTAINICEETHSRTFCMMSTEWNFTQQHPYQWQPVLLSSLSLDLEDMENISPFRSAASSLCWVCWRTLCMRTRSCTRPVVCCCTLLNACPKRPTSCWTTAYYTCSSTRCPPSTAWRTGNVQYLTSLAMLHGHFLLPSEWIHSDWWIQRSVYMNAK